MSYAGEVARGISEAAGKAADGILVTTQSGQEVLERIIYLINREIKYDKTAEVFDFSDGLHWQAIKCDDACEQVRRANTRKIVPVRPLDW